MNGSQILETFSERKYSMGLYARWGKALGLDFRVRVGDMLRDGVPS